MRGRGAILSNGYRSFLAVAEAGSIRAAARDLNIVSSAVNRQILMLEEDLGIRLFDRVGRGLRLSEAGKLLLGQVRETVDRHDDIVAELDTLRGLKRGRVRLASVESIAAERLPRLLADFWRRHPGVETSLVVAGAEEVHRLVETNSADLGFTFSTRPLPGMRVVHHEPHALGAVLPPGHARAGAERLHLEDLLGEPLVLPARGLSLRAALEPALARVGKVLTIRGESDSLHLTAELVRAASAIGFMTRVGIERELASRELAFVPLADPDLLPDHLGVVARERAVPSLSVAALSDFIEESWGGSALPTG
ncbi:MAG: LysR family transcriptional regulator [Siculibacillus sp.]|nr:LysR family transcriptional regulator [Siculibacillus sp.]